MADKKLSAAFDSELVRQTHDRILRRYIDLPKLLDFLRTGELYLQKASAFDDGLEGTLPEKIRENLRASPEFAKKFHDSTTWERQNRERNYLSCWTLGAKDNMALWKLYGSASGSVAITTTIRRLASVAPNWAVHGKVVVKKVQYIDHLGPLANGVWGLDSHIFGFKHAAYSFENEVRIVVTRAAQKRSKGVSPNAIRVPVKLDDFLRSIIVAPEAGDWFFNLVQDIAGKYNIKAPVRRSALTILLSRA